MTAQVPVMMTSKMRQDLRTAGFSDAEIAGMTPTEAWEKLGGLPEKPAYSAAKRYRDSSLSFFPLRQVKGDIEASKKQASDALKATGALNEDGIPSWGEFQRRLPTDSELTAWFNNGKDRNIAIVTGKVSRGLVVPDFDDIDAYKQWAAAYPEIASKTATAQTGKGYHVFLRMDDPPGNGKFEYAGKIHDVKGEGGYIVAWPSVHGSGRRYEWLPGQAPWEVGIMAINSLADVGIVVKCDDPPAPVTTPAPPSGGYNPLEILKAIASIPDPATRKKLLAAAESILIKTEEPKKVEVLSADVILGTDYPEQPKVIPDLLPVGLTILAGKPKLGKSWLALQEALAVASGGKMFDREVMPGPVLFCALEDSPRRLKDRMLKQNWPKGLPVDFLAIGEFDNQIGGFANGGIDTLARLIQSKGYRLVVIDTLARALRSNNIKDARSSVEMVGAMSPIQEMAHKCNAAVVLIDHMRKAGGADIDVVTDTMDSISKAGVVDTLWGLYRERGKVEAKLQITGRDIDEQTLAIKMDWLTACWQCEGDYYAKKISEAKQQILDALEVLGSATNQRIAEATGQNKGNVSTRLKELIVAGLVSQLPLDGQIVYIKK